MCAEVIGKGANGVVFKGQAVSSGKVCAIKIQSITGNKLEKIEREMKHHKEAGSLYGERIALNDAGVKQHLSMQSFVPGASLQDKHAFFGGNPNSIFTFDAFKEFVLSKTPDSEEQGNQLFDRIDYLKFRLAPYLQLAHEIKDNIAKGKIHRDIKEGNVVFSESGKTRLVDFGGVVQSGTPEKVNEGTPYYMPGGLDALARARESHQYTGEEDIHALGVMLKIVLESEFEGKLPDKLYNELQSLVDSTQYTIDPKAEKKTRHEVLGKMDNIIQNLEKLQDYILLMKPVDLSLLTNDEMERHLRAYERLKDSGLEVKFDVHIANPLALVNGAAAEELVRKRLAMQEVPQKPEPSESAKKPIPSNTIKSMTSQFLSFKRKALSLREPPDPVLKKPKSKPK